jgi:hypothetical protein
MTIVEIYSEIVKLNESALTGKFTLQQIKIRLSVLEKAASKIGTQIDVLNILGSIEADILESQSNYADEYDASFGSYYDEDDES